MADELDPTAFAMLSMALAAAPARSAALEAGLLELSRRFGATLEDRACAVAYAAGRVAREAEDPGTLLAAMFALARVTAGVADASPASL